MAMVTITAAKIIIIMIIINKYKKTSNWCSLRDDFETKL